MGNYVVDSRNVVAQITVPEKGAERWKIARTYIANYGAALAREKLYLEVIDDLMTAIASNIKEAINDAYKQSAAKIAAAKKIGLIAR